MLQDLFLKLSMSEKAGLKNPVYVIVYFHGMIQDAQI